MTALNPLIPDTDQLIAVMQEREVFRFTFLYAADGRMRVITVEPSRPEAGELLLAISEVLKVGRHRQDSGLAVRDASAVAVYIAELIRDRDEYGARCKELLDQVQCLQWDLNALQVKHGLGSDPSSSGRR